MLRKALTVGRKYRSIANRNHTQEILKLIGGLQFNKKPKKNIDSDLKEQEQIAIKEKQRKKSNFSENYTAALALAHPKKIIRKNINNPKILLSLSQDNIVEHASRRVDLFFYTLIAYYNTQYLPIQGDTLFQHGLGRKTVKRLELTQACHSSFFPSFVDRTIHYQLKVNQKNRSNIDFKRSIISGTHFFDSLNSTMELPLFVNNFDRHLEGKIENPSPCRQSAMDIIHKVSIGDLNPIEGLRDFFLIMKQAFVDIEEKKTMSKYGNPYLDRDSYYSPIDIKNELVKLQKQGTFEAKWYANLNEVSNEYIEMLLRLNKEEREASMHSLKSRNKIYLKKMKEIQIEILTTKSSYGLSA